MKRNILLVILLIPFIGLCQTPKQIAKAFVEAIFNKQYDTAISYIDSSIQNKMPPVLLGQITNSMVQKNGDFKKVVDVNQQQAGGYLNCIVNTVFEKNSELIRTVFNSNNKIIGFFLVPHRKNQETDDAPNAYNIKSGNLTLPGTLLIAKDNNQKKLVILVHGSGANDRDETLGQLKPFKDLAQGLLKAGISTYRYDKRTFVAPKSLPKNFTVDDVVTNDVLNIIHYFNNNDTFQNYKLYVIGHSLGAFMAPRIAKKAKGVVNGVVMMAGPARPIQDLILEQLTYLDSLTPSKELDEKLKEVKRQIHYMHGKAFNQNSPSDSLLSKQQASFWLSFNAYKPLEVIKSINTPFLILQGEKDYQVRMADFNLWKRATKGMSNISFKSYPGLSHLFMQSNGTPSPKDYEGEKHIPSQVINDIASWIKKNG